MAYVSLTPAQTDKKSPVDDTLMDRIRLNEDDLDSRVATAGAQQFDFRVNGPLSVLTFRDQNVIGTNTRLDGAQIHTAKTLTLHDLYMAKPGDSGTLEVDARKYKPVLDPITEIVDQYQASITSIARVGASLSTQSVTRATAQIATQSITRFKAALSISYIIPVGGGLARVGVTTTPDSDWAVDDYVEISGATAGANDGTFQIVRLKDDGTDNLVVRNAAAVLQSGAAGSVDLQAFSYDLINPADSSFVATEKALFASHTSGANDGTLLMYAVNSGGNNIVVKNQNGVTQGGVAGTIDVLRFDYDLSAPAAADYVVTETIFATGHTSGNNDGTFPIVGVNVGGNNVRVFNENGVVQGGAAGTIDTNRWVYTLPTDPSSDFSVSDTMVASLTSNNANSGNFSVVEVNRSAANNLVIHNSAGIAEGAVGQVRHLNKIFKFAADQSATYTANVSRVEIVGCVEDGNNGVFDVNEVNRGGGANFNIVAESFNGVNQLAPSGRVVVESRTVFSTTPKITVTEKIQEVSNGVFNGEAVLLAGDIVGLEILQIPTGEPEDVVLTLT